MQGLDLAITSCWSLPLAAPAHALTRRSSRFAASSHCVLDTSPCHRYCSSPGGQRQLSGWQGAAEETKKWQLEPKESCREHEESVGHSVQAGTAFSHFVQRQPHLQQAQTQSQPCCKAPREQIGQLWGKMHSPADALL